MHSFIRIVCLVALSSFGCSGSAPQRRPAQPQSAQSARTDSANGIALYRQGRFAEAEPLLAQLTHERPGDADGWAYLGLTKIELDKVPDGEIALHRALELDANHADALYGIGLAHARSGRVDEAIRAFEQAIRANPSHAYAHYQLGLAFNQLGRKDRAINHLNRFLQLAPNAPEAPKVRAILERGD